MLPTHVLCRGFLDGRLGFVLAEHNAESTYYRYLKMWLGDVAQQPLPPPPRMCMLDFSDDSAP